MPLLWLSLLQLPALLVNTNKLIFNNHTLSSIATRHQCMVKEIRL